LDIEEFKELKNPLVPRKVELEQQIVALQTSKANWLEPMRSWILEANQAEKAVSSDNWLNEIISPKGRLEPLITRSNLDRCF
jgi:hypothetical protein